MRTCYSVVFSPSLCELSVLPCFVLWDIFRIGFHAVVNISRIISVADYSNVSQAAALIMMLLLRAMRRRLTYDMMALCIVS